MKRNDSMAFCVTEALESRQHFAAHIIGVFADHRGRVTMPTDVQLDASTVNNTSAVLFTAGADGVLNTGDDVLQNTKVAFNAAKQFINIICLTPLAPGTPYRVNVKGALIKDQSGIALDGEYNGDTSDSGDGTPGGNYKFQTANNTVKTARFYTSFGFINVALDKSAAPKTVANFLYYTNTSAYDGTFFHRSVANFIIQGGAFKFENNQVTTTTTIAAVPNEPSISNTRGTIAMAKLGSDPNSATDQWFFNTNDNASNLDNQNGGFTVFGRVTNNAGLAVMDAIAALPKINAGSPFDELPVQNYSGGTVTGDNLVYVTRVGIRMLTLPLTQPASAQAVQPTVTQANPTQLFSGTTITETNALLVDDKSVL